MKKIFFLLLFLLIYIDVTYSASGCTEVSPTFFVCEITPYLTKVRPIIHLNYTDESNPQPLDLGTLKYLLLDNTSADISISNVTGTYNDDPNQPYINYTPTADLSSSNYTLNSTVAHEGGLLGTTMIYFEVYFPSIEITLLEPIDGVSGTSPYTVKIKTESEGSPTYADCRYHELHFYSYDTMTNEFTPNEDNTEHTISVEGSKNLYVRCKDEFENADNTKFIQTSYTSSAPTILALVDPTTIIEEVDGSLQTTVGVAVSSGPNVQCKYSSTIPVGATDQIKYDSMTVFTSMSYASTHQQTLTGFSDQQSYTYYIMCKGQNGLFSNIAPVSFSTDTTVPLTIASVNTPAYSSSGNVFLNVTTNKFSSCTFHNGTDVLTITSNLKAHTYLLSSLSETSHTYYANCTKGSETTSDIAISFAIDSTAPITPTIDDDSNLAGVAKGYTWKTDELEASWSSSDNQSGIIEYQYRIETSSGTVIVDWTSTGTSTSVTSSGLDLSAGAYKFKVKAKNGAGQWSAIATSDGIIVDTTKKPEGDITAPTGTVTKETFNDRIEVTLTCTDNTGGSGCNTKFYGLSAIGQSCTANIAYTSPVNVTSDSLFCWQLIDRDGNRARDNETILFSGDTQPIQCTDGDPCTQSDLCPGTYDALCNCVDTPDDRCPKVIVACIDTDKDEYGVGCIKGNDCDDTNAQLYINCPSGCLIDSDGDTYGLACDLGFDCDDSNADIHQNCTTNCIIDSDHDGYGLGCIKGLDCDDFDPLTYMNCLSGCLLDSDGDGYGLGCVNGPDCNDIDYLLNTDCSTTTGCTQDNDADGYGINCADGPDCDDTDPSLNTDCSTTTGCTQDTDGDNYGLGCNEGLDCDDDDPEVHVNCDSDGDGMSDDYELANGLDPDDPDDANRDNDNDGLTNKEEYNLKLDYGQSTDPNNSDTDGDGYTDKEENDLGFSPVDEDEHPKSQLLKIILISFGLIIVLGGGGYFGYNWYKNRAKTAPVPQQAAQVPLTATPDKAPDHKRHLPPINKQRERIKQQQRSKIFSAFDTFKEKATEDLKTIIHPKEDHKHINHEPKHERKEESKEDETQPHKKKEKEDLFSHLPGSKPEEKSDIFSKLSDIAHKEETGKPTKNKKDKKGDLFDTLTKLKK